MQLGNLTSLEFFRPEILLGFGGIAIIMVDLVAPRRAFLGDLALVISAGAMALVVVEPRVGGAALFSGMVVADSFARFFRALIALATIVAVWMSIGSEEVGRSDQAEYYSILLVGALGMFLMAEAANLLMAYLALEIVSLASYVLTGILRNDRRAKEAALKYLIYGGVASGLMVYGMSWLFGLAGALDFAAINVAVFDSARAAPLTVFIALVLALAGMGYKIASVPFHMWAPDVYEGAPIPITTFLAVGSKAAGFALLTRFFYPAISRLGAGGAWSVPRGVEWPTLLLALCALTMTLGNLAALNQDNLKRMLAYSSIAQAGYALMGFVVLSDDGLRAMLVYLFAYYVMDAGAFLVVMIVANATGREDLGAYRGLAARGGAIPAVALTIFLLSLTGIPATIGFIGKFYVFAAAIRARFYILALIGILNSVVSLYYYMRPVRAMFLEAPDEGAPHLDQAAWNWGLMGVLAIATVALGLYPPPVIDFAARSIRFFLAPS